MRVEIDTSEMTDKDFVRATKLGNAKSGEGHDNFLKGILVQMDVAAPLFGGSKPNATIGLTSSLRSRRCTAF
jgi:hypothetical protein